MMSCTRLMNCVTLDAVAPKSTHQIPISNHTGCAFCDVCEHGDVPNDSTSVEVADLGRERGSKRVCGCVW